MLLYYISMKMVFALNLKYVPRKILKKETCQPICHDERSKNFCVTLGKFADDRSQIIYKEIKIFFEQPVPGNPV